MTDWTIILRSLRARLFSTVTTVLTVAVAVALMLVLLVMRHSGRKAFERGTGNMHLIVSGDSSPISAVLNGIFYAGAPARAINWERFDAIAQDGRVDWAIPNQQGDSFQGLPVLATTPQFFTTFQPVDQEPWKLAAGRFFAGPFEVVLGAIAARQTGLKVGDSIYLTHGRSDATAAPGTPEPHVHREFSYTVVGVLAMTASPHDRALFTNLDSAWIIHAHDRRTRADSTITKTTVNDLTDEDRKITGIYIRALTRPGSDASPVLGSLAAQLRKDTQFTVAEPRAEVVKLLGIVSNVDKILIAMAAVVLLSSGIAIMLALYNSMEQRRRQLAVLRVLGCSKARLFGLVVTESALLGIAGVIAGTIVALVGSRIVVGLMKAKLGLIIEPEPTGQVLFLVGVGTVLLACLAGIVPAVMAYRTSVAKNLKPLG